MATVCPAIPVPPLVNVPVNVTGLPYITEAGVTAAVKAVADAVEVCGKAKVFTLAESLGGVESLIEHPGKMTHGSVAGTPLEVPADLVRLSVGIEDVEDIWADIEQALSTLSRR